MHRPLFGEFMGTMVLIIAGDGAVANVLLKKSKGEGSGWIVITTGWGLGVIGGYLHRYRLRKPGSAHQPCGHASSGPVVAQLGQRNSVLDCAICGSLCRRNAGMVGLSAALGETPDQGAKLGIFCTAPAIRNIPDNCLTEVIATTVLVDRGLRVRFHRCIGERVCMPGFGPYLWGMLVWVLGLCIGGPTGYAMNPARDLGPRMAHFLLPIAGKGKSDWGYALVPIIGSAYRWGHWRGDYPLRKILIDRSATRTPPTLSSLLLWVGHVLIAERMKPGPGSS